ncbi:MAG: hypothetical protein U0694_20930 [Anaerolineae bacterium]
MDARLERIILSLVKQYTPQLLGTSVSLGSTPEERTERMCRRLANDGVLLLVCEVVGMAGSPALVQTQNWVSGVARVYSLLARRLFPSYARLDMQYIDSDMPAVVIAIGECNILMQKMAGFVLPYLAARQMQVVSEAELRGLIDILLEELEAGDLPRAEYQALRAELVTLLQRLISSPVRLLVLRTFDRPIFFGAQDTPPNGMEPIVNAQGKALADLPPAPQPPAAPAAPAAEVKRATNTVAAVQPDRPRVLPETGSLTPPKTKTQETGIVLPRNPLTPGRGDTGKLRRPPVPPLPNDKK